MPGKEIMQLPLLDKLYQLEFNINKNVQTQMRFAEYLFSEANTYLDPQMILDYWIPLAGIFGHKLLTRIIAAVSFLNVVSSVFKWTLPEYRPIWWIKEFNSTHKLPSFNVEINTCDTSAGFPSSHTVTFAAFALIVFHCLIAKIGSRCQLRPTEKYFITQAIVSFPICYLWCSRLFYLTEFLHQCIGGYLIVMTVLHLLHHNTSTILKMKKIKTSIIVCILGSLTVGIYFAMLHLDKDPHWSVRMAFKWCADPLLLRHEAGPIFVMFRDFGYLLGVSLSCPLFHNFKTNNASVFKRFPAMLIIVLLNLFASVNTPKHLGRWVFLLYELGRNCAFSYTLLTIIPKIVK